MRKLAVLALFPLVFIAACGGGGGGSFSGGGGGGGGGGQTISPPGPPNVETLTVNSGPAGVNALNTPYISVTFCQPNNPANCATVDYIEVDTGSTGLRVIYDALPSGFAAGLTPVTECT